MPGLLDQWKGQELKLPSANRYLQMISSIVSRGLWLGNTTARAHGRQNTDSRCCGTGLLRPIRAKEPPLLRENSADAELLLL